MFAHAHVALETLIAGSDGEEIDLDDTGPVPHSRVGLSQGGCISQVVRSGTILVGTADTYHSTNIRSDRHMEAIHMHCLRILPLHPRVTLC